MSGRIPWAMTVLGLWCAGASVAGQGADRAALPEQSQPIEATLVDQDGKPVAGAGMVIGELSDLRTKDALERPVVRSDAQGKIAWTFRHRPRRGSFPPLFYALVAKPGFASMRVYIGTYPPAQALAKRSLSVRKLGVIRMISGGSLRGRVRGAGGRPVAGATVFASELLAAGVIGQQLNRGNTGAQHFGVGTTDAQGLFDLPCTLPEGVHLQVNAPGHYESRLEFASRHLAIDVGLTPSGWVEGQVVDEAGKPLAAVLTLASETGTYLPGRVVPALRTDAEGRFKITLRTRGRYRLTASLMSMDVWTRRSAESPVYAVPRDDVRIEFGAVDEEEFKPLPVIVRTKDGRPVAGARVGVVWRDPKQINAAVLRGVLSTSGQTTDGKGATRCPPPRGREPFTGGLIAVAEGFAPTVVKKVEYDDEKPPEIEVELAPESGVAGQVVDAVSGEPIAGAKVTVVPSGSSTAESGFGSGFGFGAPAATQKPQGESDAAGRFRVGQLAPGEYEVRVTLEGRPPSEMQVVTLAAETVRKGLRIALPRGETWTGRLVVGADGDRKPVPFEPPAGWHVTCGSSHSGPSYYTRYSPFGFYESVPLPRSNPPRSELSPQGEFAFHGLAPARYRLYLRVPAMGRWGQPVERYLQTVRVRRRALSRDIDVRDALPGIVRGRVRVVGAPMRPGQIMVFARAARQPNQVTYVRANEFRGFVADDGTYEFRCAPGSKQVFFVDAVTGGVIFHGKELVKVTFRKPVEVDYEIPLTRLRVRLRPEVPGGEIVVGQLQWDIRAAGSTASRLRYNTRSSGLATEGRTEFVLSVPPGVADVVVRNFASSLDPELAPLAYMPFAEAEAKVELGKLCSIDLVVPAPPTLSNQAEPPPAKAAGKAAKPREAGNRGK